jgi:hypothetical protein
MTMKLDATITSVNEDCDQLTVSIYGWADSDPEGTTRRPLGSIDVPSTVRNRRAYHVGRRLLIEVRPV